MTRAVEESNRRMLRARDAMDRDYAKPLDIPTLAQIAYVSEAHFIRVFRATFGETPHRYLQRRRVERAMFLLSETDRSVTEICFDVGFASLGTFSRTFTDIVGEPPTTYRWRAADLRAVPACFAKAWTRPSSFGEAGHGACTSLARMPNTITHTQVYVLDQDEALDFYVGKLGLRAEHRRRPRLHALADGQLPWSARPQLLLEKPGPPAHDEATAEQIRELVTKGAMGMAAIIAVDDIHKTYEELVAKGVEFTEEPTERFYGTDCGLRDPFGNHLRIGTPKEGPIEVPDPAELTAE